MPGVETLATLTHRLSRSLLIESSFSAPRPKPDAARMAEAAKRNRDVVAGKLANLPAKIDFAAFGRGVRFGIGL